MALTRDQRQQKLSEAAQEESLTNEWSLIDGEEEEKTAPTEELTEEEMERKYDIPIAEQVLEDDTGEVTDAIVIDNNTITDEQKVTALNIAHDSKAAAHPPFKQTYRKLRDMGYAWTGMKADTRKHTQQCIKCQLNSREIRNKLPMQRNWLKSNRPWQTIAMDIVVFHTAGTGGHRYAVMIMDVYSRYVETTITKTTTTNKIAAILVDHILRRGIPTTIMTDSGTNLISNIMNTVYERLEITKLTSSPYHQQSNGCIERAIGSIKHILRKLITHSNYKQWNELLPFAISSYNAATHSATGVSPDYAINGYDKQIIPNKRTNNIVDIPLANNTTVDNLLTTLQQTAESIAEKRNRQDDKLSALTKVSTRTIPQLTIGGTVWTKRQGLLNTLQTRWYGPFIIQDIIHNGQTIIVKDKNTLRTVSREHVKPAYTQSIAK